MSETNMNIKQGLRRSDDPNAPILFISEDGGEEQARILNSLEETESDFPVPAKVVKGSLWQVPESHRERLGILREKTRGKASLHESQSRGRFETEKEARHGDL